MNNRDRAAVWRALDELVRQHSAFSDAIWALPEMEVRQISELSGRFRPEDPIETSRFLFDSQSPDMGIARVGRHEEQEEAVRSARLEAVRTVVQTGGVEDVRRLVDLTQESFAIGWALGELDVDLDERAVLSDLDNDDRKRAGFAQGFVYEKARAGNDAWLIECLDQLDGRPLAQARVLRAMGDLQTVWQMARDRGPEVESSYWKEFVHQGRGHDFNLVAETAQQLLDHARPGAAVDLLALYVDRDDPKPPASLVADALGALLKAKLTDAGGVSSYELQRLLEFLRGSELDEDEVALLEWQLLPGLGYGARSPILEQRMARDPGFFVEVLSMCFKRKDGEIDREPSPDLAQNAFRLLHEWQIVPGSSDAGGEIDAAKLTEWLNVARRLLVEADRLDIGFIYIGHIFAHARGDLDGTWPTLPVRNAIQSLDSDEIDRGLRTEKYNMRGVTSRGLTDGGQKEFELADEFEQQASLVADKWPRTAAMLRSLAEGYRSEGRSQDEEVSRFRQGLIK